MGVKGGGGLDPFSIFAIGRVSMPLFWRKPLSKISAIAVGLMRATIIALPCRCSV